MKFFLKNNMFIVILFSILILLILFEILIAQNILPTTKEKFIEIIEIISSGLTILAAAIGAYLGAKLNRENILKLENEKKVDIKKSKLKLEIKKLKFFLQNNYTIIKLKYKNKEYELIDLNLDALVFSSKEGNVKIKIAYIKDILSDILFKIISTDPIEKIENSLNEFIEFHNTYILSSISPSNDEEFEYFKRIENDYNYLINLVDSDIDSLIKINQA